jgi:dGTP triphosphohydrolase
MADNFDMKKFLVENKLGAYSKLKNEGEAAYEYEKGKAAGEKEEKETLTKEDLGQDRTDAEAEKMMDFLYEKEKTEETSDVNEGEDVFADIDDDIAYGTDSKEDAIEYLEDIIDYCKKKIVDLENEIGFDEEDKEEVKEALTPEMFERMDALTSHNAQIAMIRAAEIMMNELTEEGFEVLDIREYFTQLIANDI